MPIFDYQCSACGKQYDIFHKVREIVEDIVCPDCGSPQHTRLISAPHIAGPAMTSRGQKQSEERPIGCCGGGACRRGGS